MYNHNGNGGSIPVTTWNTASTCNVTGITSTNPTSASFTQNFGNFIWNNTGQTNPLVFNSSSFGTKGTFTITSTNSTYVAMASGLSNTYTNSFAAITVNNNSKLYLNVTTSSITPVENITITGNLSINGTSIVDVANGSSSAATLNQVTKITIGGNLQAVTGASFTNSNSNN